MNKYHNWTDAAMDKLNEDFCKGIFHPQNESDVKCHLYYSLLQTKLKIAGLTSNHIVLSEFACPTSDERFDLVIGRRKRNDLQTRLVIEIKETSRAHLTASEVEDKIKADVEKLRRYKKTLEENKVIEVLKYYKKPKIFFFFRGSGRHGIPTKTEQEMKNLQRELDDILLNWGPR